MTDAAITGVVPPANEPLTTADGRPLKSALARAERMRRVKAMLLVLPLLLFIGVSFLFPIALMLFRSVDNPLVADHMPRTVAALEAWDDRSELPDEAVYAALVADLAEAREDRTIGRLATRLNYETGGLRSTITRTGRRAARLEPPFKEALIGLNDDWANPETFATIKRLGSRLTDVQYLAAVDRRYDVNDNIVAQPEVRQIYVSNFIQTLWMSIIVTVACLVLGYPVAYLLSILPLRYSNVLMILDVAAGAHDLLDRAAADRRHHQRHSRLDWHPVRRRAHPAHLQRRGHGDRDDADPAALHDSTAL